MTQKNLRKIIFLILIPTFLCACLPDNQSNTEDKAPDKEQKNLTWNETPWNETKWSDN